MNAITELITEAFSAANRLENAHRNSHPQASAMNYASAENLRRAATRVVDELADHGCTVTTQKLTSENAETESETKTALTGAAAALGMLGMASAIVGATEDADTEAGNE